MLRFHACVQSGMNKEDGSFQRKALYGKQGFLVKLDTVRDTSEEKSRPPPFFLTRISAHVWPASRATPPH